jgi:hypothetical protein
MTRDEDARSRQSRGGKTSMTTSTLRRKGAEAVADVTGQPVVRLKIDGAPIFAAFELNLAEHRRRVALNVGALTSTPLLHGLWLLPEGVPVPVSALPDVKVERLRSAPHSVAESDAGFERLYSPAGVVRAVAFVGRDAARAIERAIKFTPIHQRLVVVPNLPAIASRIESMAREWGVGLIEVDAGSTRVRLPARRAEQGVPSVYRWWIAELAYSRWLYESTQLVS